MAEADESRSSAFHWLPASIGISVLAIVLVVLYMTRDQGETLLESFQAMAWWTIPAALTFKLVGHITWASRIAFFANGIGVPLSVLRAWRVLTCGVFGGAVTPGRVAGEPLKFAVLARGGVKPADASLILVADRTVDLVYFLVMGLAALVILPLAFVGIGDDTSGLAALGVGVVVVVVVLLVLAFWRLDRLVAMVHGTAAFAYRLFGRSAPTWRAGLEKGLYRVRDGIIALHTERPAFVLAAYGLTIVSWTIEYGILWATLQGFGHDVPYWAAVFVGVLLTLIASIPVTPGGAGLAEVGALALLTPIAPGISAGFIIVWRSLTYYYDILVGGPLTAITLPRRVEMVEEPHKNG